MKAIIALTQTLLLLVLIQPISANSNLNHGYTTQARTKVKVLIAAQFEIGANTGDRAGELQHWYERYFLKTRAIRVPGAETPIYCNNEGICGTVLSMGKVRSSSSMTAILLDPRFDFSNTYFLITGVGGTPPNAGTIGAVFWADWLIDYDLGHRWAPQDATSDTPTFSPRKGYEDVRLIKLNPDLVNWAYQLSNSTVLKDSPSAASYRSRYTQKTALRAPFMGVGTHIAGDTFFHGPGLSAEANYIAELYGASPYVITEMEGIAVAYVIGKLLSTNRIMSIRSAVNFDQGNPQETTLEHLDPEPGNTPGGFEIALQNNLAAGSVVIDHIISKWEVWQQGIPKYKKHTSSRNSSH